MVRGVPDTRDGGTMKSAGPAGAPAPCGALAAFQSNGASQVTALTQSAPSIFADALARSTSALRARRRRWR